MVRRKSAKKENLMLSTITIKGQNYSNTRKLYYLQDNVREINSEGENWFQKLQQSWVNKYNSKCTVCNAVYLEDFFCSFVSFFDLIKFILFIAVEIQFVLWNLN